MKIAAVGRPNTGKSTFINTLARVERMIVSEQAGTTRDAVDVHFELDGLPFLAIDTAGVRRKAKIRDSLDFYSIHRAERSIRRADVVLLFLDPTQGISRLDKQLADYIAKQYKPCIFTVNKWDLMAPNAGGGAAASEAMRKYAHLVQHAFRSMSYTPLAFITATTGKNVKALVEPGAVHAQAGAGARRHRDAQPRAPRGGRRAPARHARHPHPADLLCDPGQHGTADDRAVRQPHVALRRDLSTLPAERLPRKAAVPRHPDQALPPRGLRPTRTPGRGTTRRPTPARAWRIRTRPPASGSRPACSPSLTRRSTNCSRTWATERLCERGFSAPQGPKESGHSPIESSPVNETSRKDLWHRRPRWVSRSPDWTQ